MGSSNNDGFSRRTFLKYGSAASVSAIFAGCTGNQETDTTTNDSGDNTTETTAGDQTDMGDQSGTEFDYVTTVTPSSLDPMKGSDNLETILLHNVYDPLLYYTDTTPPELETWLAEDYSVSDDGKTYTFKLNGDATFHNGDQVTASDVKYSVQRMMDMGNGFSWMWSGVLSPENVEVVDDTTVKMTTNDVFAPFLYTLPFLYIVNQNQVEEHAKSDGQYGDNGDYGTAWLEDNDAGSGPYKLTKRDRKREIVIESNDDWWGTFPHDQNGYETVTTEMVQEAATVAGRMREGAQMSDQWLPLQTYNDLSQAEGVRVHAKATFNPFYVYMHTQREPLNDVHVRRAISYAFDYEAALNDVMAGDSDHLRGPLPDAMWSHTEDLPTYDRDLEKAQAELDQSDYSASDIDLNYTYVSGLTVEQNMGLLLQSNLQELGAKLSVNKAPWSKITEMAASKESTPDMLAIYLSFSYADPDTFLYPAWHSDSHGSWTSAAWYQNDQVDQLLTEGRRTVGKENRVPIYEEAQRLIAEDAPALFVMNQATRNALSTSVKGFKDNGITGYRQTFHRYYEG